MTCDKRDARGELGCKCKLQAGRRMLFVVVFILILGVGGAWYAFDRAASMKQQEMLADLPPIPDLSDQVSEFQNEVRRLDAAVRSEPDNGEHLAALAMRYHAAELYPEADACYQLLAKIHPDDKQWLYYRAISLEVAFEFDSAIGLFKRVSEMDPSYPHVWARLGDLQRKQGTLDEAIASYERALVIEPLHPNATLGLAYIWQHKQEWEHVVEMLEPLLEANPLFAPATRLLAHACDKLGREVPVIEMADPDAAMENVINEPLLDIVYDYSPLGLLKGDPDHGGEIVIDRCTRCHSTERINDADKNAIDWRRTIRRMQSVAGRATLGDRDAADILAFMIRYSESSSEEDEADSEEYEESEGE